ncbi:unnamed protein product [Linum tenue]|uniref:non-specific serine/threonine protein kinase n=1 Tax=Linum tenue TaxID=586396 RepID=A0AAV0M7M0_9ROSI|nr:unnamed protein product [Linum tenue]
MMAMSSFLRVLVMIVCLAASTTAIYGYNDLQALLKLKSTALSRRPPGYYSGFEIWDPNRYPIEGPSTAHCYFSGVTCNSDSRVVALDIRGRYLDGPIPGDIGLLAHLVNLTISSAGVTGPLPVEMANLTSLKLLDLSNNELNGSFPAEIARGMTQLQVLDISGNKFTGMSRVAGIAAMKNLRHLNLQRNLLSGGISPAIGNLTKLESLLLDGNQLSGEIPNELCNLKSISILRIRYNSISGSIPSCISKCHSLTVLDLSGNQLSGQIPELVSESGNGTNGAISERLCKFSKLKFLCLQGNQLSGQIPAQLFCLSSLLKVDLSDNKLSGALPATSFWNLAGLVELDLSRNSLFGPIPESIGGLPNLEVLQLPGNNLSELPKNLGRTLKLVNVSSNHLMGSIPRDLCKGVLQTLILDNNYLTGPLPQELGHCKSLTTIQVSNNLISGHLPPMWTGALMFLELSNNRITGRIPRDLCNGELLQTLILANNYLTGPIPQELGRCKSLTIIQVSYNLLNGTIPAGIFQLPSANLIKLDNNLFSGQLPSFMWTGEFSRLVLSNNRITGRIPPTIGNLTKLDSLFLDGNEFSHKIPDEFCNLRFISMVNISSNKITGNIPSCLAKFYYLTVLDLSRNQLCGHIPCSLVNGTRALRTLDLSHNKLSGRVPKRSPFFHSSFSGNPKLLASSKADCSSKGYSTIVIIGGIGLGLLIWSTLVILVMKMRKQRAVDESIKPWTLTNFQKLPEDLKQEHILDCLLEENIIGKGGAGVVYLGSIPGGVKVAIKQPIKRNSQRDGSFAAEVRTLGQIRHKHIVKLLGCVSNSDRSTTLLLYEYMPNGSLAEALHGPNGGSLSWEMRYKIAVEAAMGLSYLHHDCSPPIIHRDIKPHNILLDSVLEAHIADFGLSKLWHHSRPLPPESSYHMSVVAGTFGYLAPEYAYTLKVDEKIDVYSYGVVMLELISGRKAVGGFDEGMNIVMWVRELASKFVGKTNADVAELVVLEILDPRLAEQPRLASTTHMLKIAMMCVDTRSSARPTMREVLHLLTNHQTWNMIISPDHET